MSTRWSAQEMEVLATSAGKQTCAEIAALLGRSISAVWQQASKHGIRVRNKPGDRFTASIRRVIREAARPVTAAQIAARLQLEGAIPPEVAARKPTFISSRLSAEAHKPGSRIRRERNANGHWAYSYRATPQPRRLTTEGGSA